MWVYKQLTGELFHDGQYIATGYAGNGDGLNNPDMQYVVKVGPLPQGKYTIGPSFRHDKKGPFCMRLTPDPKNVMHGRAGFLIHGDNKAMNKTASEGCIILPYVVRVRITLSGDNELLVEA